MEEINSDQDGLGGFIDKDLTNKFDKIAGVAGISVRDQGLIYK